MGVILPGCSMPEKRSFQLWVNTPPLFQTTKNANYFRKFHLSFPLICDLDKQWYPEAEQKETKGEETMAVTNLWTGKSTLNH